jgi:hypothetical protein
MQLLSTVRTNRGTKKHNACTKPCTPKVCTAKLGLQRSMQLMTLLPAQVKDMSGIEGPTFELGLQDGQRCVAFLQDVVSFSLEVVHRQSSGQAAFLVLQIYQASASGQNFSLPCNCPSH